MSTDRGADRYGAKVSPRNRSVILDESRIRYQIQEEIEKLREEGEVPEILDLIRQIEIANKRLQKPPKKHWIH